MKTLIRIFLAVLALAMAPGTLAQPEPALLTRFVPDRGLEQVLIDLQAAISSNNYTFVRDQAIDSRLVPRGLEARRAHIVYFCNFAKMNRALAIDVRAAQFLPCRVTMLETDKGVELLVINPAWMSQAMGNPLLHQDCLDVKKDYLSILDEVAL